MNGYRSHLLCRPVFIHDAKEKQSGPQVGKNMDHNFLENSLDLENGAPSWASLPKHTKLATGSGVVQS
jgi:hypothetical protein